MLDEINKLPASYALKQRILPLNDDGKILRVAMADAGNEELLHELQFIYERTVQPEQWDEAELLRRIEETYHIREQSAGRKGDGQYQFVEKRQEEQLHPSLHPSGLDDRSVILTANKFIADGIRMRASDLHVESYEGEFRLRFRIDGKLLPYPAPPAHQRHAIISRLKIMADMDIAERRRPQDGRIRMQSGKRSVDIRVSTMPTDCGEKVVLRILDKSEQQLSLDSLGMELNALQSLRKVLNMPYGMALVTGPTGSGKTTTLYSALNFLNRESVNIITIEDPVEYNLPGINQTMVRADIGLSFADILRTVLRQDPDIIMLGEIRDCETAEIAVRAALTGHLLLTTLHTNDALSTIVRLVDMGIEPFLVANSLKIVLAQRLVRRICMNCKAEQVVDWEQFAGFQLPEGLKAHPFYHGKGCRQCNRTGFSGREAVIESLLIDDQLAEMILRNAGLPAMKTVVRAAGQRSLAEHGLMKARQGVTTLAEAIHETYTG